MSSAGAISRLRGSFDALVRNRLRASTLRTVLQGGVLVPGTVGQLLLEAAHAHHEVRVPHTEDAHRQQAGVAGPADRHGGDGDTGRHLQVVAERRMVDGRNALDPERWRSAGWTYRALGRP